MNTRGLIQEYVGLMALAILTGILLSSQSPLSLGENNQLALQQVSESLTPQQMHRVLDEAIQRGMYQITVDNGCNAPTTDISSQLPPQIDPILTNAFPAGTCTYQLPSPVLIGSAFDVEVECAFDHTVGPYTTHTEFVRTYSFSATATGNGTSPCQVEILDNQSGRRQTITAS